MSSNSTVPCGQKQPGTHSVGQTCPEQVVTQAMLHVFAIFPRAHVNELSVRKENEVHTSGVCILFT